MKPESIEIIVPCLLQALLTSNLGESETPKNLECFQKTGYPKGQEFEALRVSQSPSG